MLAISILLLIYINFFQACIEYPGTSSSCGPIRGLDNQREELQRHSHSNVSDICSNPHLSGHHRPQEQP